MKRTPKPEQSQPIRINRYLSMCGIASRRKADEMILQGKVEINHKVVQDLGIKIDAKRDKVYVNGKQVVQVHDFVYLVMNKPR
ncbi:MAG: S4 domain-containing protein, partial [Bacteroidota bacterium]